MCSCGCRIVLFSGASYKTDSHNFCREHLPSQRFIIDRQNSIPTGGFILRPISVLEAGLSKGGLFGKARLNNRKHLPGFYSRVIDQSQPGSSVLQPTSFLLPVSCVSSFFIVIFRSMLCKLIERTSCSENSPNKIFRTFPIKIKY